MDERHCTCKYIFLVHCMVLILIHPFTFFEQLAHGDLNPSLEKRDHQKGKLS